MSEIVKEVNEAVQSFKNGVSQSKNDYKTETAKGFRDYWATWYGGWLGKYLRNYEDIMNMEDPYERAFAVQDLQKEYSKQYSLAKMVMFAREASGEIVQAEETLAEAVGMRVADALGGR